MVRVGASDKADWAARLLPLAQVCGSDLLRQAQSREPRANSGTSSKVVIRGSGVTGSSWLVRETVLHYAATTEIRPAGRDRGLLRMTISTS